MNDPLRVYLHDHLAGSNFAIEVLDGLAKRYPGDEAGNLAAALLREITEDRGTLEKIIEGVGRSSPDWKDATAWFAEKASRLKLHEGEPSGLGAFEAWEALALGIQGKLALWRVLPQISTADHRVNGFDFASLANRAEKQFAKVEEFRLRLARSTFERTDSSS